MEITKEIAQKVLTTVDAGLCSGKGIQVPGQMCVEAAVCFALGLPHSDEPPCVARAVRAFKIRLNDSGWSSKRARAKGMRRVAVAQLGSTSIDERKFVEIVVLQTVKQILPMVLRRAKMKDMATKCESAATFAEAWAVAKAASAAAAAAAAATADAAYAAAYAAAYVATADAAYAYAAVSAADVVSAAVSAADAAAVVAAVAVYAVERNQILSISAEIATQALIECGSEGSKFLYLCV